MSFTSGTSQSLQLRRIPWRGYTVLISVTLLFLAWSLWKFQPQYALEYSGRRTTGVLTAVSRCCGTTFGSTDLVFTYQVGSQNFTNHNNVQSSYARDMKVGDRVEVTYLPNHPQTARTEPSQDTAFSAVIAGGSIGFCIVTLFAVGYSVKKRLAGLGVGMLLLVLAMACMGKCSAYAQNSPNARLVKAVEENDLKAALEALDQGAAPDATIDGNPVSCTAAYHGQTALLKALLDHGARLEARKFDDHLTLLMFAGLSGNPETVKLLLDRKVKVNLQDELGETALMTVREPPTPSVTPAPSDPSNSSSSSGSADPAKPTGRVAILQLLLHAGAEKEVHDIEGRTALMRYAKYGMLDAVETLADAGAKLNKQDRDGSTALILAAGWQTLDKNIKTEAYAPIVQCLLQHKADANIKNRAGLTALMAAKRAGHEDIVALLAAVPVKR